MTLRHTLQKEAVRRQMGTGIFYTEFSYMRVEAYDYWHGLGTDGGELQMGGRDQSGNITAASG